MKKINIARLVRDLGGPTEIAKKTSICRTTPYRWITSDYISSNHLGALVTAFDISLDQYFEDTNDKPTKESRKRVS